MPCEHIHEQVQYYTHIEYTRGGGRGVKLQNYIKPPGFLFQTIPLPSSPPSILSYDVLEIKSVFYSSCPQMEYRVGHPGCFQLLLIT